MCGNNIKRNFVEIYYGDVAWNYLTQERAVRRHLMNSYSDVSSSVKEGGGDFPKRLRNY